MNALKDEKRIASKLRDCSWLSAFTVYDIELNNGGLSVEPVSEKND